MNNLHAALNDTELYGIRLLYEKKHEWQSYSETKGIPNEVLDKNEHLKRLSILFGFRMRC